MNIKERVIDIIHYVLGCDKERLKDEAHFINDLGCDSLDAVEIIMELEEEFDIQIPDSEIDTTPTIGSLVKKMEAKLAT
jgi:acyl carrier protein